MTLLIELAIRSSMMLAVGLLISACLARRSAALRHRVLAAAMLGAILVVPLGFALPEWTIALPAISTHVGPAVTVPPAGAASGSVMTVSEPPRPRTLSPLVLAWVGGVLAGCGALMTGLVRVSRVAARAERIDDARWLRVLDAVAARYGLTRAVAIARTDSPGLLATWGMRRPQVLLPPDALQWPPDRIHVVLSHELAHIHRHDWLVQLGAEVLRAILWFNPLAWIACTRLRRESEQACDDEVLGTGVAARDYATHLLELARQCRRPGSHWASAVPMAHPSTLERRIAAMLNARLDRRAPTRRVMATLGIGFLLVTLSAGSLRARQVHQALLSGTIYDASGAVLPGVQVTLVDANESKWVATSDASGRFGQPLPVVGPGKYVLEVALPGFRALSQSFELRDPRDWDRAITLQVGDLSETVTIRESRAILPKTLKPTSAARQPIRVGGNVRPPRKELDVRPVYPATMRAAGLTGIVPIEAVIGRDGTVSSVRVLSAQVHPDFAIAAIDAVRQWRFTPTLLNGQPVDVVMTVSVRFDLSE